MRAIEFISSRLFPLKPSDSCSKALEIMNSSNIASLPVVDNGYHLGYISTGDIMDVKPGSKKILSLINVSLNTKVSAGQHFFEVVKIFSESPAATISVVDDEDKFIGIIAARELVSHISSFYSFQSLGSFITLQIDERGYSVSELGRIAEYNSFRILSLFITQKTDEPHQLMVHLALDKKDIRSLTATFERYGYTIADTYLHDADDAGMKSRFDQLMKYLEI